MYCLLHQQNTPKPNNTVDGPEEVVRGGLSGQHTDHNAHIEHHTRLLHNGVSAGNTQRQGHNTARLTFVARHATATVRDTTPGALTVDAANAGVMDVDADAGTATATAGNAHHLASQAATSATTAAGRGRAKGAAER
jgi:hypothetical protein